MNKSRKSLCLDMSSRYENVLKNLEEIVYFLRIQERHEEADLVADGMNQVKTAMKMWDDE